MMMNLDDMGSLTSSVLVAEIWEPPHVAESDDLTGHREHELHLAAPLAALVHGARVRSLGVFRVPPVHHGHGLVGCHHLPTACERKAGKALGPSRSMRGENRTRLRDASRRNSDTRAHADADTHTHAQTHTHALTHTRGAKAHQRRTI